MNASTVPVFTIDDPKFKFFTILISFLLCVYYEQQYKLRIKSIEVGAQYSMWNLDKVSIESIDLAVFEVFLEEQRAIAAEEYRLKLEFEQNLATLQQTNATKQARKQVKAPSVRIPPKLRDFRRKIENED